jgi:hypothetical protein
MALSALRENGSTSPVDAPNKAFTAFAGAVSDDVIRGLSCKPGNGDGSTPGVPKIPKGDGSAV